MQNALKPSGAKATSSLSGPFEGAHLRLTAIYVSILALILSISSSITYSAFSNRLERRFQNAPPRPAGIEIENLRAPTPKEVRADLINTLFIVNGLLLVAAGILSYWLAKITLEPIQLAYDRQRRFLSDASHELRTPLAVLQLELENEQGSKNLEKTQAERIESYLEEVGRMSRLVQDLLALSRLDEQVSPPNLEAVDLKEVIQSVTTRLRTMSDQAHIRLESVLPEGPLLIHSHAELLVQALSNLIKNAIHYNKEAGSVTVTAAKEGAQALITIQDTGVGIAQADVDKIFERFYRVDQSRSRQTGGSGLGLSIVHSIIEQLHGHLELESTVGVGTVVHISLPLSSTSSLLHESLGTVEK